MRAGGRGKGTPNKLTQSIKDCIEQAFHKLGGRDYLVKVGSTRPDVFLALMSKIMPSEARLAITASYVPLAVRVEQRDPIPASITAPQASNAVIQDAQFVEVVAPLALPAPASEDDWLSS